ncbi:MAG: PEP/pyruvate-binding domain-containing protein [candidate division Zixibacteria bacterium]|nr:PEP/pyruvate-binding domain-containing protein [candidate division Zixibacteria bacterium]
MTASKKSEEEIRDLLQDRSRELGCLYQVEEIMSDPDRPLDVVCREIVEAVPGGWRFPDVCRARITIGNDLYTCKDFAESPWVTGSDIVLDDTVTGTLEVYYLEEKPPADDGPFLNEEVRLVRTIAERLASFMALQEISPGADQEGEFPPTPAPQLRGRLQVVLDMLRRTDPDLYVSVSRKMLNYLCWSGIGEAEKLMQAFGGDKTADEEEMLSEGFRLRQHTAPGSMTGLDRATFEIAVKNLTEDEILSRIRKWIHEDKLSFLVQTVDRNLTLPEVVDAIRRYRQLTPDELEDSSPRKRGVLVSLIRRFLSDQVRFINVAKEYIEIRDLHQLLQNAIYSPDCQGKLGGKSAWQYLQARIISKKAAQDELLANVKTPRTWHIVSDLQLRFVYDNNFDDVVEQKYKDIKQVRLEYPRVVQTFKEARFPADMVKGLSVALDDLGDGPLIVRSSSLLEDRLGTAFAGKYRSLFLANRGSKRRRLAAVMDAVAEVYASTFSPDPIEYRARRGLLDFNEQMGVMIQEVVGRKIGRYFLPSFSGVAFSHNELRWSPHIAREDGLVRMVPGLGTRAVTRRSGDYPVIVIPGRPEARVNVNPEDIVRYSPHKIDVINLETEDFESLDVEHFLGEVACDLTDLANTVSVYEDGNIRRLKEHDVDCARDKLVVTFEGLISSTPFCRQVQNILKTLESTLNMPVEIEFASDGNDLYLLQCRPQNYSD